MKEITKRYHYYSARYNFFKPILTHTVFILCEHFPILSVSIQRKNIILYEKVSIFTFPASIFFKLLSNIFFYIANHVQLILYFNVQSKRLTYFQPHKYIQYINKYFCFAKKLLFSRWNSSILKLILKYVFQNLDVS